MNFRSERSRDSVRSVRQVGLAGVRGPARGGLPNHAGASSRDRQRSHGWRAEGSGGSGGGVDPEVVHLRDHQIPQMCSYSQQNEHRICPVSGQE